MGQLSFLAALSARRWAVAVVGSALESSDDLWKWAQEMKKDGLLAAAGIAPATVVPLLGTGFLGPDDSGSRIMRNHSYCRFRQASDHRMLMVTVREGTPHRDRETSRTVSLSGAVDGWTIRLTHYALGLGDEAQAGLHPIMAAAQQRLAAGLAALAGTP